MKKGYEEKMGLFRENKLFIVIMAIAVAASAFVCFQRMSIENDAKTVDFIIDYKEILALSKQSEEDIRWWLTEFNKMGIDQVGLQEENLITLTDSDLSVEAKMMKDVRRDVKWKDEYPAEFVALIQENSGDDFDVVVVTESEEMYQFVFRAFTQRYDSQKTKIYKDEKNAYFLIDGTVADALYLETYKYLDTEGEGFTQISEMASSKVMYLNLGLLPEKVQTIQDLGMVVVPRTIEFEGWNDTRFAEDVVSEYEKIGGAPAYWIMAGTSVPGYDDGTEFIINYLNEHDTIVGVVENTTQRQNLDPDGMKEVITGIDYNTVRVFSVWGYIQNRYGYYGYEGAEEIDNSLFRAIVERNIKVIYYKPMKMTDDDQQYITDIEEYQTSFANLEERLKGHGITIGKVTVGDPFFVSLIAKILIAIGTGTAALILLAALFTIRSRHQWILFGVGCLGVLGAFFIAPNMASLLTSLAAAILIPCLAALYMIQQASEERIKWGTDAGLGKILLNGGKILLIGVVISLFGAMMTAAPISSVNYMLELDIFRGVKIAQLLPLAFYALIFLIYFNYLWGSKQNSKLAWTDIHGILTGNVKVWMVFIGIIMAVAGYIYLARTGHETNISASTYELIVRNFLEEILFARPRSKEFLIAFPAVFLFVYSMVRNFKVLSFIFGTAGVIGFTSIVNTFEHIRTPLELGFVRTGYAVAFGIVLGVIFVAILDFLYKLYRKWRKTEHA